MKNKSRIPQIRFKGFEDEWENNLMADISSSYSGGTPSAGVKEYYGGNIPFIRSGEIHGNKTELFLSDKGLTESSAAMVDVGCVLYALYGATSGEVDICQIKGAINQAILAIYPHSNISPHYLSNWLKSHKDWILNRYLQGGQGNLSASIVKNLHIDVPVSEEQFEIGNYFRQLDEMIAEAEREVSRLEKMKIASLQKMFPRPGATTPEIRFAGFSEPWKERPLGEIAIKVSDKNSSMSVKETFTCSAEHGIVNQMEFFDHSISKANKLDSYNIVEPNCFVYNPRVSTIAPYGPILRNKTGRTGVISPLYTLFCFTSPVDFNYLDWFFKTSYWHMFMKLNGDSGARHDRFTIRTEIFFRMPIALPELDEQKAIGEYFRNLDTLISAKRKKLAKLRNIKQACLDKMFVNPSES